MDLAEIKNIQHKIFTLRGVQVMLDSDLASLYLTETKFINRAVKRNPQRFPETFMFQLTDEEWADLKCQIGTSRMHGGRRTLPNVFSEQGVAMLSAVLSTDRAIAASIQIMQAFVAMRKFLLNNASVFQRLDQVELKQLKTDEKMEQIFKALEADKPEPDKGIFFDGQVFEAYAFVSNIIRRAKKAALVEVHLFTKAINKQLALDIKKANEQYNNSFKITELRNSHDRFLMIDQKELYHLGASLKDLGKKWFAFSRMDAFTETMLTQLKSKV